MSNQDPLLRWFGAYDVPGLIFDTVNEEFKGFAEYLLELCPTPSAERTIVLRQLMIAAEAMMRACVIDQETRGTGE